MDRKVCILEAFRGIFGTLVVSSNLAMQLVQSEMSYIHQAKVQSKQFNFVVFVLSIHSLPF